MKAKAKKRTDLVCEMSLPNYMRWLASTLEALPAAELNARADEAERLINASEHVLSSCDDFDLLPEAREPLRRALAKANS